MMRPPKQIHHFAPSTMYKFVQCPCGSNKIENKDAGLCGTCNKARNKAERMPTAAREPKSLTTRQPFVNRSTLPLISAKMKQALKEKKQAYAVVDAGPQICVSCGDTNNLTHSHIVPVGQHPELRAVPENIVLECMDCHTIYEHNKPLARRLHASWAHKMAVMQRLAPSYYELLQMKLPNE